jgi:uncharacterized protein
MASASHAASFDCSKASSNVEKTICASPALSKLDDELAADYKGARSATVDLQTLQANQRSWLRERNACSSENCISKAYTLRIGQLRGRAENSSPTPVSPSESKSVTNVTNRATSAPAVSRSSEQKLEQGWEALNQEDYTKAFKLFQQALAEGNLDAESALGVHYVSGAGTQKNMEKGLALLEKSAKRGSPEGQFVLGSFYYSGEFGVPENVSRGLALMRESAKQGYHKARARLIELGIRYQEGRIPIAYKASEYKCPGLGSNPVIEAYDAAAKKVASDSAEKLTKLIDRLSEAYDGAAKKVASESEATLTKLIDRVCVEAQRDLRTDIFQAGNAKGDMWCYFSDLELTSMVASHNGTLGIFEIEASELLEKRCVAFYSERYAPVFAGIGEAAARAVASATAARQAEEDAKAAKALAVTKEREERKRKTAEDKAFLERQREQAIARSGVAEKDAILWGNWANESSIFHNADKVCLERLVVRDQMERVGEFNAPPKGEFEKTDQYQTRVAAAKAAHERTNPVDPRVQTFRDEFNGSFSPPVIRDLHYNADKELFSFNVVAASCPQISIPVTMATPLNDAKAMKQVIETMIPVVILELSGPSTLTARHIYFFFKDLQTNFKTNYPFPVELSASNAKKAKTAVDAHRQMVASMREANMSEAQRLVAHYNNNKRRSGACDNAGSFLESIAYSAMPENMKIVQIQEMLFKAHQIGCI